MKTPSNGTIIGIIVIAMIIYGIIKHFTTPEEKKVTVDKGYYKPLSDPDTTQVTYKPPYVILEEDTSSIKDKYQSLVSAAITDNNYNTDQMKTYLYQIYNNELNNPIFNGMIKPNAVGVYLYSSESKFRNDKPNWEMMLWKNTDDKEPKFSQAIMDETKNDPESQNNFNTVQKQFQAKGLDFCSFYYQVNEWIKQADEMENKADEDNPGNEATNMDKSDRWLDRKMNKWLRKNNLPDSIGKWSTTYGAAFCK